jgi:hypothetical protein
VPGRDFLTPVHGTIIICLSYGLIVLPGRYSTERLFANFCQIFLQILLNPGQGYRTDMIRNIVDFKNDAVLKICRSHIRKI